MDDDPLGLDPGTMRRIGYQTIDMLVESLARLNELPALRRSSFQEVERRLQEPPPASAHPYDALLDRLSRDVLTFMAQNDHPRFFGYVPGCGTWPATMGGIVGFC